MWKNYFKIALRNLWKNKVLSFINIAGLALGMAGAALLILNIQYEVSVDQFHEKKDHIYKAYNKGEVNGKLECWNATPPPLAPALEKNYPEVKEVTRVSGTEKLLSYGDKKIKVQGNYTDPSFLQMFSFPLVKGAPQSALNDTYSLIITEGLAKKIFGTEEPVGKIIRADNADNFTVTGVLKDLPYNTEFKFEFLLPWEYVKVKGIENGSWTNAYASTFVELHPASDINAVNHKISDVISRQTNSDAKIEIFLYPLTKEHLQNRFENGKPAGGRITNLYFLGTLAGIILLIACINFMNLNTARSEKRAKEVGIRKVVGAAKKSLVIQFISESVLLAALAGVIALVFVQLTLPAFSSFAKVHLVLAYQSPLFWLMAVCFVVFTGILAGSYPAFYLSSFKPVKVLKGVLKNGNSLVTPRKILVVVQFALSVFLINFIILFRKQINHSENREIGFVKEALIFHSLTDDLRKNYTSVKNELLNSGTAVSVCQSSTPITRGGTSISGLKWEGMDSKSNISFELVTTREDFVKTNGLKLAEGRDIDVTNFPTDTASCLVNETALKVMGLKNPIGQIIKDENANWKIVGVIKDFIINAPNQAIQPMFIRGDNRGNFISIRLNSHNPSMQSIKKAETIIKKYNPNFITEYGFADDDYAAKFKQAKNASALISSFALIAIFISCMGLLGLSIYMAETRTREVGIRKVLGATVASITSLFAKDFLKLVLIAAVIASPLAWLFMNFFLQQFTYRTSISWWILVAAGAAALLIALLTISFQSIKAAVANPVKNLRTE